MTKRDFFILIIKLFGLTSVITSLFAIFPAYLSYGAIGVDVITTSSMLFAVALILSLFILLIFRSEQIVDWLKLDRGFDNDRIELGNLKTTEIMQFGIIVIGGLLILNNISQFITHTYFALREDLVGQVYGEIENLNWAVSGINIFVGYLLLTNHGRMARALQAKTTQEKEAEVEGNQDG